MASEGFASAGFDTAAGAAGKTGGAASGDWACVSGLATGGGSAEERDVSALAGSVFAGPALAAGCGLRSGAATTGGTTIGASAGRAGPGFSPSAISSSASMSRTGRDEAGMPGVGSGGFGSLTGAGGAILAAGGTGTTGGTAGWEGSTSERAPAADGRTAENGRFSASSSWRAISPSSA